MSELIEKLAALEEQIQEVRKKRNRLLRELAGEEVENYELADKSGNLVHLYDLFGDKEDLVVIHNMGSGCPYCTLWADGFNGTYKHYEDRAGFVVVSPDPPAKMSTFAAGRNWNFKILSNDGGKFTRDMGYENEKGGPMPGVSTFHRDKSGRVARIAHTMFGPGDDFCPQWHILDMLKDGPNGWQPKYSYDTD